MLRDRTFLTLVLALVGLAAYATVRPASTDPIEDARSRETEFYIRKIHPDGKFDGIVIGDSRGLRGVSTEAMGASLPHARMLNFSVNACGLNREIFAAAESHLRTDTPDRFIVLAPTALTFQPWKRQNDMYREYKNKARDQVWVYKHLPGLAHLLQPVSPTVHIRRAFDIAPPKLLEQKFHPDGWIATRQTPVDDLTDLSQPRSYLVGNSVDPVLIGEFMEQTRDWAAKGIRVFAFYPPAQPARTAMEDSMLGFDREGFARAFTDAGGIWLSPSSAGLQTYDGSHLEEDSAIRMSRELGALVAARLAAHPAP